MRGVLSKIPTQSLGFIVPLLGDQSFIKKLEVKVEVPLHLSDLFPQPLLRCVQSDIGHMSFCKLIEKFLYLILVLIVFRSGRWSNSKDCEAWLEWWLIRRYLVTPVIVADYSALLRHPRMHILLIGLKPRPRCMFVLKQLDCEDLQFLL